MEYRNLGRSGLRVSEICLGSWLTYGNATSDDTAFQCVEAAFDAGINFFDTANGYARGEAERVIGGALKSHRRDSYVLATKVYFPQGDGPNDRGLSRKHIMEQCEASLRRMGVEYVDLYQAHRYDVNAPLEETLRAFDDLVTHGKVLYLGFSEWSPAQIAEALGIQTRLGLDRFISSQPYYNALGRGIEREVIPLCEREGIGQIVFSPLAQGVLTGKYSPGQAPAEGTRAADPSQNMFLRLDDATLERVQRLRPIAEGLGLTMPQLALAWVLRQPNVSSAIIGASKPSQVVDNAGASGVKLSPETVASIDQALEIGS
jgi:aryl-alcohol dehydrogenase-like predicted oxidoreductase